MVGNSSGVSSDDDNILEKLSDILLVMVIYSLTINQPLFY